MRVTPGSLLVGLAATTAIAFTVACGTGDPATPFPTLDDVSFDADAKVDLVDRDAILAGAADYDLADAGAAPDLTDAPSGFLMQFSGGEITEGVDSGEVPPPAGVYDNYITAVAAVIWADAVTAAVVGPPAIAVAVAADGDLTRLAPNVWLAENTIPLWGVNVTTDLTVAWVGVGWLAEMRLTTDDGRFDDTLWFNGFLGANGGVGWWDLYENGTTLAGVVEWVADGTGNGEFGIAATNGANAGDLLAYAFLDGEAGIVGYDASADETAWVASHPDASGEVRLPSYNSGLPACWGTDYQNVACE